MPVLSQAPWRRWSLSAVVMAVTVATAVASGGLGLHRRLNLLAEERLYQTREIQEGLSGLHRDLQMINHLAAISSEPSEAEAREYVEARREQLSMVRWLGVLSSAHERPRVLLASAQMRGYDPRRDAALSPFLGAMGEGALAATVPGSHRELASLAIVLGPNDSGNSMLVALIDGDDLLSDSLSALTHSDTPLHLMLQGQIVGHWPDHPVHSDLPTEESWPVSVATLNFALNFGATPWLPIMGSIIQQPLVLLLGGLLLAAAVRGRARPALAPATPPAPAPPPLAAAIPAADIHRHRLWQLGELAAALSHDLGQPLNVIRLTAESAQDAATHNRLEGGRLERTLRNTVAQTMRAQAMIDAVVEVTRRPNQPPAQVRPVETVRRALAEILPQIRAQGARLRWHADLSTPAVLGHAPRLGAAVRHLLVNGLEALASRPQDQGAGTLWVECRPDGDGVAIVVADDGPGFPPALRSQLNEPLQAMAERHKSCGLGLTIALGVAAEMGATLSVADGSGVEGGPGTRVTLALPPARRALLLVEDDLAAASELTDYLSAKGWLVRHCPGGNPALALFLNHGADAVVTDLHMSDGDGWQLIERLHALAPDLPIIAMSTTDGEGASRAVAAGAAIVMQKPVSLCDLYDELAGLFCDAW